MRLVQAHRDNVSFRRSALVSSGRRKRPQNNRRPSPETFSLAALPAIWNRLLPNVR